MDKATEGVKDSNEARVSQASSADETARNLLDDTKGLRLAQAQATDTQTFAPNQQIGPGGRPGGFSVIPPYMLRELAFRNPNNKSFADTLNATENLLLPSIRPNNPSLLNENGRREVYDAKGKEEHPGEKARFEGDAASGDKEVDDTYDFAGATRDFYKDVLERNSIDDNGMKLMSTVNYGQNYENAFWNGTQMTYGRPGAESPFKTFVLMDVAGHEVTHGVTEKVAGMIYYGQSGALNESMSDVFGELIQQKAKGIKAEDATWDIGEGIWKDGVKGTALRNMLNPGSAYNDDKVGKDPQPGHMKDYVQTWSDNGGVHYNSGIPNRAFALFAKEVGGFAWEGPGKIWYEAMKNAGSNPSFSQFAQKTLDAAAKLGMNAEIPKLQKAWEAVGVTPSATALDTITPGAAERRLPGPTGEQKPDTHDHKHVIEKDKKAA